MIHTSKVLRVGDLMKFGHLMKLTRDEKNLNQEYLAKITNISIATIRRYERGKLPKLENLSAIIRDLGLSPRDLKDVEDI